MFFSCGEYLVFIGNRLQQATCMGGKQSAQFWSNWNSGLSMLEHMAVTR